MSKLNIKQQDITDCGAACLSSISSYYKLYIPISKIRQLVGTDKEGTNLMGLIEGAEKLGFDAKGVKGAEASLHKIPIPAIAHIIINGRLQHFVVIYKVSEKKIRIMDPGIGQLKNVSIDSFIKQWTGVLVILLPNDSFMPGNEKVSLMLRFWYLLKPHKFTLIQSLIGSVFYTLLGFSTSIYIQKITDHVLVNDNTNLLNIMSISMVFLLIIQIILSVFKDIFLLRSGQEIDARLILGYYKHLLKLPQKFFDTMRVGEILSRINDAVNIRIFINNTSLTLMVNIFIVLFSFMLMFTYYWKLGLLMLAVIPIYAMIFLITNALNKKTERVIMEASADLESQLVESLHAIATVKQFGLLDYMHTKTETKFIKLLKIGYRSSLNHIFSQYSTQSVTSLFTILLLWIGSFYVIAKELSPGELFSFYAIIGYFTGPVSALISSNKAIQNAIIAADRLFEILDLEIESKDIKYQIHESAINSIEFKNVSFRYSNRQNIFSDLNLCLKKGEITAIVGESGSGKSTLLNLLQGLYPINKGSILLNERDIKYMCLSSVRALISVVPQTIHLFDGNIIDNITIGSSDINMKKVLTVCTSLEIMQFIEDLPQGFYTQLGENGASLSGGQKQRIAIARALYKDPEVLVLDEAAASLDSEAEYALQKTLLGFKKTGKTVILVSHRLLKLTFVDNLLVLKDGKLVEQGSHNELIHKNGSYKTLWEKQFPQSSKVI
ncbi:peptidase domain-containing ABC transporter [Lutimonas vermicola]|uniref:Peptidase domain-containing ABC transporter n=1 Tax=Lutimonas vermicola TaxID=414288 RepID=A0ABU9L2Y2_9FLAO